MPVRWSTRARRHLVSLRNFLVAHNPGAASAIAARILGAVELLRERPSIGRPGRVPGTRELVISGTPYIVAYTVLDRQRVEILAVFHGKQTWPQSL